MLPKHLRFRTSGSVGRRRRPKRQQDRDPSSRTRHHTEGKRMERRKFLTAGGLGLAASAVAAPAVAQSMPEVKWRLAASWPKALDTLYGGCEHFSKRVAEITDNRFQIQPFA